MAGSVGLHHFLHTTKGRCSNLQYAVGVAIRTIFRITFHQLTEQAVVFVFSQYCVGPCVVRLQSHEFVACFLADWIRLTELGAMIVPIIQSLFTFCEQPLVFRTNRSLDGELIVHIYSPFVIVYAFCSPTKVSREF